MDRRPPRTTTDEIDLYINTYYSLLRSTGEVRVRAFEEAHMFSNSSLHTGAREAKPDVAAFAYSAGRLPDCMPGVRLLVLGQREAQFEAVGLPVSEWQQVRARGRRRVMRFDGSDTLAVFVTSISDIDDLIPIVTAYQIEWNKMRDAGRDFGLDEGERERLKAALDRPPSELPQLFETGDLDLSVRLLNGSYNEYQRLADRWWTAVETEYVSEATGSDRPLYFVSSNTHSLVNLLGGYARAHREEIAEFAEARDPEGLSSEFAAVEQGGDAGALDNMLYYLLRAYLHDDDVARRLADVQAFDAESGISTISSPGYVDVSAQVIELSKLDPKRIDARLQCEGVQALADSDAVIVNIDYPLGLAAYHHLSRVAQSAGELRGLYVMGKAATLNGRVGDAMISETVYDEHSKCTYLLDNCFEAADVQQHMRFGTVLDNQKAVTVRSAFLQNREYMSVFYNEGYTVMEMEAGPYLSATFEIVSPNRHPRDEIVNLSRTVPFELGILHYASDTPYSRRQSLLSKSMSYFGVESTYACAIAIARRILEREINHCRAG